MRLNNGAVSPSSGPLSAEEAHSEVNRPGVFRQFKTVYHDWEWKKRLASYQIKTTISRFSQSWTRRRWGIDCEIVYPPADSLNGHGDKTNLILSTGRFTATGHSKKQVEMVSAFHKLEDVLSRHWKYFSVGGLSDSVKDVGYFRTVKREAGSNRVQVIANVKRRELEQLYGEAKIFWHAAGYNEGDGSPELAEHFGIATVEAMSAGCVPIVINKGGQPEIVEHGISGFLWNSLQELGAYTELLMRDEQLRSRMAEEARSRAALFSRERFLKTFLRLISC